MSNFYILRRSKVIDVMSSFYILIYQKHTNCKRYKNCSFWKCELKPSEHAYKIFFNYLKLLAVSFFAKKVNFLPPRYAYRCFSNEFSHHYRQESFDGDSFASQLHVTSRPKESDTWGSLTIIDEISIKKYWKIPNKDSLLLHQTACSKRMSINTPLLEASYSFPIANFRQGDLLLAVTDPRLPVQASSLLPQRLPRQFVFHQRCSLVAPTV